ncbi:MAG: MFS transporter [Bosea sp.]|jgi:YNFM family putative membrane transporter|nr:MFS transporter [Bosea sp. (in: a-proteobacteria)]
MPAAAEAAALKRLIWVLGAAGFASTFTMRLLDPLVPTLAGDFTRTIPEVAMMATAFSISYAVGQPFLGPVADAVGKARTILVSLAALSLMLLASAFVVQFETLFIIRMLMGIFAGGIIPVAMAAIGDRAPMAERQVALGRFLTVMIVGQTAGAAASGFIADHLGWRAVMVTAAGLAGLAATLVLVVLRPRSDARREALSIAGALGRYRNVFGNPRTLVLYGLVIAEGALIFGIMPYVAAILAERAGVGPTEAGLAVGGAGLGGLIYGFTVRQLVARLGPVRMVTLGGLFMAAAIAVFAIPSLPWWTAIGCFIVQGFGFFLMHGTFQAQATELAPEARGSAVALFACALFCGHALGPVMVGALKLAYGAGPALLAMALGIGLLGLIAPRALRL